MTAHPWLLGTVAHPHSDRYASRKVRKVCEERAIPGSGPQRCDARGLRSSKYYQLGVEIPKSAKPVEYLPEIDLSKAEPQCLLVGSRVAKEWQGRRERRMSEGEENDLVIDFKL